MVANYNSPWPFPGLKAASFPRNAVGYKQEGGFPIISLLDGFWWALGWAPLKHVGIFIWSLFIQQVKVKDSSSLSKNIYLPAKIFSASYFTKYIWKKPIWESTNLIVMSNLAKSMKMNIITGGKQGTPLRKE